jgi:hypothetical protein
MKALPTASFVVLALAALAPAQSSLAADFDAAHFVQAKCTGCHDSTVYTRPNRRVDSLVRLESQVRMCDANLNTKLYDDEIQSVVSYLNGQYYKFEH